MTGLIVILAKRISYNQQHEIDFNQVSDYSITQLVIDYVAFRLVYFCKQTMIKSYLFLLFFLRNSISVVRYLIIRLEKRFYRFTESIKEREEIIHQGKVSSFLKEIREHKENILAEFSKTEENEDNERGENEMTS